MSADVNLVTHLLDDLNLHCTDHAPFAECEGCRLQVEMHTADLLALLDQREAEIRQHEGRADAFRSECCRLASWSKTPDVVASALIKAVEADNGRLDGRSESR